jgi:hypothetical protein
MIHGSRHSNVIVRGSLRAGSKVRRNWLLLALLPGLILMGSPASQAARAYKAANGERVCEGFGELTAAEDPVLQKIVAIAHKDRTTDQKLYVKCSAAYAKKDADWAPKP